MSISLDFLSGDHSACLKDKPQKAVKLPARLPGELYNADDQCSRAYGDKSTICPAPFLKEVSCYSLKKLVRIVDSSPYSIY